MVRYVCVCERACVRACHPSLRPYSQSLLLMITEQAGWLTQ